MSGPVVVGVVPGQSAQVLDAAADLAAAAGLDLSCVFVDVTAYRVDGPAGRRLAPIDPDGVDDTAGLQPESLEKILAAVLRGKGVTWSMEWLSGEPAHALAQHAKAIGASLIVVGARERKPGSAIKEFAGGSVARHLVHLQDRPVVVVPVPPDNMDRLTGPGE